MLRISYSTNYQSKGIPCMGCGKVIIQHEEYVQFGFKWWRTHNGRPQQFGESYPLHYDCAVTAGLEAAQTAISRVKHLRTAAAKGALRKAKNLLATKPK